MGKKKNYPNFSERAPRKYQGNLIKCKRGGGRREEREVFFFYQVRVQCTCLNILKHFKLQSLDSFTHEKSH